ncbi:MAG: hypothetical protein ACE5KH_05020 [Candidatus Geothermarchaeales archaeon]
MPVPADGFLSPLLDLLDFFRWQLTLEETVLLVSSLFSSGLVLAAGIFYLRGGAEAQAAPMGPDEAPVFRPVVSSSYAGASEEMARLLLQREILSYAITRIFESEAEGKLSVDERERLVSKYEDDLKQVNGEMEHLGKFANLEELEEEKKHLAEAVGGRLSQVESKIEELRVELGISEKAKPSPPKKRPRRKASKERSELQEFMEEMASVLEEMERIDREE